MDIVCTEESDLKSIQELVSDVAKNDVFPFLDRQGKQTFTNLVIPNISAIFDRRHFISVKATYKQKIIGFAALRDGVYLTHLFVASSWQNKGVGRKLLATLLSHSSQDSVCLLSSLNAISFYKTYGFEPVGIALEKQGLRFLPMTLSRSLQ